MLTNNVMFGTHTCSEQLDVVFIPTAIIIDEDIGIVIHVVELIS